MVYVHWDGLRCVYVSGPVCGFCSAGLPKFSRRYGKFGFGGGTWLNIYMLNSGKSLLASCFCGVAHTNRKRKIIYLFKVGIS